MLYFPANILMFLENIVSNFDLFSTLDKLSYYLKIQTKLIVLT